MANVFRSYHCAALALVLCLCNACAPVKGPINITALSTDCPAVYASGVPVMLDETQVLTDPLLAPHYSATSLLVANAYGLIASLRRLEMLSADLHAASGEQLTQLRVDFLLLSKAVDDVLDMALLELETLSDYVDCQAFQLSKLRGHLAAENSAQDERLTKAAIITGALSSALVAAILVSDDAGLKDGDAKDWIGVAGGGVAAYLAVRSAQVDRSIIIRHENNLIEAVWRNDNSLGVFPAAPWYLLTRSGVQEPPDQSARDRMVMDWRAAPSILGNENNLAILPVLLDSGGEYTESMLLLRAEMLEEIETAVDRLNKNIVSLYGEIMHRSAPFSTLSDG